MIDRHVSLHVSLPRDRETMVLEDGIYDRRPHTGHRFRQEFIHELLLYLSRLRDQICVPKVKSS